MPHSVITERETDRMVDGLTTRFTGLAVDIQQGHRGLTISGVLPIIEAFRDEAMIPVFPMIEGKGLVSFPAINTSQSPDETKLVITVEKDTSEGAKPSAYKVAGFALGA